MNTEPKLTNTENRLQIIKRAGDSAIQQILKEIPNDDNFPGLCLDTMAVMVFQGLSSGGTLTHEEATKNLRLFAVLVQRLIDGLRKQTSVLM